MQCTTCPEILAWHPQHRGTLSELRLPPAHAWASGGYLPHLLPEGCADREPPSWPQELLAHSDHRVCVSCHRILTNRTVSEWPATLTSGGNGALPASGARRFAVAVDCSEPNCARVPAGCETLGRCAYAVFRFCAFSEEIDGIRIEPTNIAVRGHIVARSNALRRRRRETRARASAKTSQCAQARRRSVSPTEEPILSPEEETSSLRHPRAAPLALAGLSTAETIVAPQAASALLRNGQPLRVAYFELRGITVFDVARRLAAGTLQPERPAPPHACGLRGARP